MTKKIKCAYHLCNKEIEESTKYQKTTSFHAWSYPNDGNEKIL